MTPQLLVAIHKQKPTQEEYHRQVLRYIKKQEQLKERYDKAEELLIQVLNNHYSFVKINNVVKDIRDFLENKE